MDTDRLLEALHAEMEAFHNAVSTNEGGKCYRYALDIKSTSRAGTEHRLSKILNSLCTKNIVLLPTALMIIGCLI